MTNKKISSLELGCLLTFVLLSTTTGIGMVNIINISGKDAYFSVVVAAITGIIPLWFIMKINSKSYDKDINDIISSSLGKGGIIFKILINIGVLFMGIVTMYSISNFIISQFLSETSVLVIYIFLGVLVWIAVSKGIEVIARSGILFLSIMGILFIIAAGTLITQIDINNIKPILEKGFSNPFIGGISLFLTNIVPILIILIIPRNNIVDKDKYNKHLICFYLIGVVVCLITTFITITSLGENLAELYQYPEYIVLKNISLFGFLDRIENIISIQWIFRCFIMLCLVVYYISNSIKKNNNSKIIPLIIISSIIILELLLFKNNTIFNEFILRWYPIINLVFLILIFLVGIIYVVRSKIEKK